MKTITTQQFEAFDGTRHETEKGCIKHEIEATNSKVTLNLMCALALDEDAESAHVEADELLCRFLRHLGHGPIVDAYEKVLKYYS
jgi:hypothetical protein